MYYRDKTATIRDLSQHRMWVALTAASGIISEHDFDRKDGTFSSRYLPGSLDDEQRCPAATAKCYVDCTKPGSHKAGSMTGAWVK